MSDYRSAIKKVYWKDVREDVLRVQPTLAKLIDELDPGKDLPFYLANYLYGDCIVEDGRFFIPNENGMLVPKDSINSSNEIHKDFEYCGNIIPAGILLNNSWELLTKSMNRISTFAIYKEGTIFGLWKWLYKTNNYHPWRIFTITSGARTAFLLPGMGNSDSFRQLRNNYGYNLKSPKHPLDHFEIFKAINKHAKNSSPWNTSLLFFTNSWINKIVNANKKWANLRNYLFELNYIAGDYWRNKIFYDHSLSCLKENNKLKTNPFIEDTVKHLLSLSTGAAPAFCAAIDTSAGPFDIVQKAVIEIYGLQDYVPTIMHPMHFSYNKLSRPVYYSLNFQTSIEFSSKNRESIPNLETQKEIRLFLSLYKEEILGGHLKLEGTLMHDLVQSVEYEFFHTREDLLREVLLTEEMPKNDPALLMCMVKCKNKLFSSGNAFVRGCIRIYSTAARKLMQPQKK